MTESYGKRLTIDLSAKEVTKGKIEEDVLKNFIGGKGFAAKVLYDELKPGTNPLSPDNVLVMVTGPLVGTSAPAFAKTAFATKSPLTGIFIDSYVGGSLGPGIRFAGYDLVTVRGKAEKPVCVYINDEEVKIEDATDLWGKDVVETEKALKDRFGRDVQIASIGPAGENLISHACVCHQIYRQAGRGGIGAVMGSKNLKAIVVKGTGKAKVADESSFREAVRAANENIRNNKVIQEGLSKYGTLTMIPMAQAMGIATVKNYSTGVMEEEVAERFSGPAIEARYKPERLSCYRCPIACEKLVRITGGKWGKFSAETEFETLMLLGPNIGITDYETIAYLGLLCDKMGMDTIQTGNAVSFVMECYEKGLMSQEDTGGSEVRFGNEQAALEMVTDIAYRKGLGKLLAQGTKAMADKIGRGSEKFAMQVKGLAFPAAWDIRGAQGHGFSFAVSDRGACHLSSDVDFIEFSGAPEVPDRFTLEGKPKIVKDTEDLATARETLISCIFNFLPPEIHLSLLNGALGSDISMDEFLLVGERTEQLIRAFNVREGNISKKDDILPGRVFEEPMPKGPGEGHKISREKFEEAVDAYYQLRGWSKDGVPTRKKLMDLGLEKAAQEIGV
ncbi:MAG: aldehyde ferredoxin oxidoreductase [Dehalococcoidia bacterium]|nr:MAG: aldehyde ferredoxin oxidoreductase [Dehalococcoidia bacterium]